MMQLKVCGAVRHRDLELLHGLPVDLVGIWHGVPGGHADLPEVEFRLLVAAARATAARGGPEPVLVTLLHDVAILCDLIISSGVGWVQLHGYQPPAHVAALVQALTEINHRRDQEPVRVIKVLHVRDGGECLERPLIAGYERAGVDLFLFDRVGTDGRAGSTGQPLDPAALTSLVALLRRPFLLAGGISRDNRRKYAPVTRDPRFRGIDVDTHARGGDGQLSAVSICDISRAWCGPGIGKDQSHAAPFHRDPARRARSGDRRD